MIKIKKGRGGRGGMKRRRGEERREMMKTREKKAVHMAGNGNRKNLRGWPHSLV